MAEAQQYQAREALGIKEATVDEKMVIDPQTAKNYQRMYMLPPQNFPEAESDPNPSGMKAHYGKS